MSKKSGFTLVELLVVITILALLTRIGVVFFQGTQIKTRDAKRKQDLSSLAVALEIYFQKNNQYIQGASATHSCTDTSDTNALYTNITPYMANSVVPKDPQNQTQYCYYSSSNGGSYRLFTKLEDCKESGSNFLCANQAWNYTVYSTDLTLSGAPGDSSVDSDGDTYQAGIPGTTCANGKPCDCYDVSGGPTVFCDGANHTTSYCAHPGQLDYFTATRGTSSQGNDSAGNTWNSYDYNCDGVETKSPTYNCITTLSANTCSATIIAGHGGYASSIPACGASANFRLCFSNSTGSCTNGSASIACTIGCLTSATQWYTNDVNTYTMPCH